MNGAWATCPPWSTSSRSSCPGDPQSTTVASVDEHHSQPLEEQPVHGPRDGGYGRGVRKIDRGRRRSIQVVAIPRGEKLPLDDILGNTVMFPFVPRVSSAVDVFRAVADAHRRMLLDAISPGEVAVGALAKTVALSYSAVSQHLAILREAGLVTRRRAGRHQLYRLNPAPLRAIHTWTSHYERFWRDRLGRLKRVLDASR
jgi:DNA-binding transcriptional ArsR family regulator